MSIALVIEDNENNMELVTFLLEVNGYQTLRATSGADGVDMALQRDPDFVILDIQLPDIMGTEVLTRIRAGQTRHIPVIAMTSFAMSGDRERLLAAGCDGYIEKPIDPTVVIDQIRGVLG